MSLDNVTLRAATLDDLAGIAAIYNQLWCNTLRNRGDVEAADFCARFNIAMQLQRSPIALVAEAEGRIIAACCIGIFEDGNQPVDGGVFGKSITDPCLGWEKTDYLIHEIAERI